MSNARTIEVTVERTITASPGEAFDAWLNPKVPGTPWNMADKLLLNPTVDGFFFWAIKGTPHYGRFTAVRPAWSDRAYLDVAEHFRVGVDGDRDFCGQGKEHPHDPGAFRPPRYRRWTIAREGLEFLSGWLSKPISARWRRRLAATAA